MNKRQLAAVERARKALERLEPLGLTILVDQLGSLKVAPTRLLGPEANTFAVVQDHGDILGGAEFTTDQI